MDVPLSAEELRERRLGLGMSQRRLADALGVTATTVARWERGERAISNSVLVRLALDHLAGETALPGHDAFPQPATPLIGRERDVAAVAALLARPGTRLLTLTGPGGSGKTALALAALPAAAAARANGGYLVELGDVPAGATVAAPTAALAAALGLRGAVSEPVAETVIRALRSSDALVLVDNCEHVVAAVADLVSLLVSRCPRITVLATSREPLNIRPEQLFAVTPLRVPDLAALPPPAALRRVPAVDLFVTRWSASHSGFRLTSADASAIAEICVRMDGLPLALEIAAAHGRNLSPSELLRQLGSLRDNTGRGPRDLPERQRSLRAVLDWSYGLLPPPVQAVFRQLGIFAGGFDLESAAGVVAIPAGSDMPDPDTSAVIDILIDASLVTSAPAPGSGRRLRLLETVRGYAEDRLDAAGEHDETAHRHAAWLARWAESGVAKFENESQLEWLDDLEAEIGNFRAAIAWCRTPRGDAELGLRLATAIRRYWDMRGLPSEADDVFSALLPRCPNPSSARLGALLELAGLATAREDADAIERHALEAARIASHLGDARGAACAAEPLTYAAFLRGDLPRARDCAQRALDLALAADDPAAVARAWMAQGVAAFGGGDFEDAAALLAGALDQARERGDQWFVGECGSVLAHVHLARGDSAQARRAEAESLAARVALKNRPAIAVNLKIIGIADVADGAAARAALLFGGAAAVEESTGQTWQAHWRDAYDQAVANARAALGARFTELWEAGRTMPETAVISVALLAPRALPVPARVSTTGVDARPDLLTYRETQVSELIAEGITSLEIARRLGISRRTAEAHTEHIMTKLDVRSRAQIAAWVERNRQARR